MDGAPAWTGLVRGAKGKNVGILIIEHCRAIATTAAVPKHLYTVHWSATLCLRAFMSRLWSHNGPGPAKKVVVRRLRIPPRLPELSRTLSHLQVPPLPVARLHGLLVVGSCTICTILLFPKAGWATSGPSETDLSLIAANRTDRCGVADRSVKWCLRRSADLLSH
ncbi:hypothetical protein J6590_004976 [Homalodisca vitripennis]|nr:hypothetical protein J6590_004976 [Homalodisca vitripennis]